MKNILSILTVMVCVLSACTKKAEPKKDVLSPEQMIAIISDMYEAEGKVTIQRLSKSEGIAVFDKYESEIFEKYQIDSATYQESYDYYLLEDTPQMELIFSKVKMGLQNKKDSLNEEISKSRNK